MTRSERQNSCPTWCALRHGEHPGEDDTLHVSKPVFVQNTLVRLAATLDPDTGAQDGPYLLLGNEELGLDEAGDLITVLTDLVAQGRSATLRAAV
jgi:hypothetical protein